MPINITENIKRIVIWVLTIAMGMEMLDTSVLNTSLPQIAASFHINPIQLKAALTIYLLSLGVFIPVSSWLVDRVGEKYALLIAIAIFTIGSIGCGLALNLQMMIIFRCVQGIGGAFLMPVGRMILVRVFQGDELVKAMAKVITVSTLGLLAGPLIGGALTTYLHWRWIFFINVPLGLVGAYYIYHYLPILGERKKTKFDLFGFILIGTGLGSLLYVCDIAIDPNISAYVKVSLLLLVIFLFGIYRFHAKNSKAPLINLNIFQQSTVVQASLGSLFARLTLSTQPFLVPLLLQTGYGYTALEAGLFTIPAVLAIMANKMIIANLLKRISYRKLLLINTILLLIVFCSYALQAIKLMPGLLIIQQLLFGFLASAQFTAMNSLTYENLQEPYISQGASLYSIVIQVSGSFGIALAALVMIAVIGPNNLQQNVPLIAFKVVFIVQAIYLLLAQWMFLKISPKAHE